MITKKEKKELIEEGFEEEAIEAYITIAGEKYAEKDYFEESFCGRFESDEDFVENLLRETEPSISDLPSYIHIDWESTASDIMMDYSEENGYYFRNI